MKRSFVRLLVCIGLVGGSAVAQTVQVIDDEGKKGIEAVNVYNKDHSISTITDQEGKVALDRFAAGDSVFFAHTSFTTSVFSMVDIRDKNIQTITLSGLTREVEEVTYAVSRWGERKKEVPYQIEVISMGEIRELSPQTSADLLENTGNVLIQRSQVGGGSPILRGFEANRVLLVIDGVRMNNAIYRDGHLQNVLTIDNNVLDRTEVVFGPTSVMYGSDALGGVMHFYTVNPLDKLTTQKAKVSGMTRFSTVNNEVTSHIDVMGKSNKWGFLTSITHSQFGDVKMGKNRLHGYEYFGLDSLEVKRVGDVDEVSLRTDQEVIGNSGYEQIDGLLKVQFRPDERQDLIFNLQMSHSSDLVRHDKMNDLKDGTLKFADWYYGPQERTMASLTYRFAEKRLLFDNLRFVNAYQKVQESRVQRKLNKADEFHQIEDVGVFSSNLDFSKSISDRLLFNYGLEFTSNNVQSEAFSNDIITGVKGPHYTRYPDAGSKMLTFANYVSAKYKTGKSIVNLGVRYNNIGITSNYADTTFIKFPLSQVELRNRSVTGSLGYTYLLDQYKVYANAATGFKAPNVDDFAKVFNKNDNITVPNNGLKPEYTYNGEIGISKTEGNFQFDAAYFYSLINQVIAKRAFSLDGVDTLVYEGDTLPAAANQNLGKGYVTGVALSAKYQITNELSLDGTLNYTKGWLIDDNAPKGHIPPLFGRANLSYRKGSFKSAFYVKYNAWKRWEDMDLDADKGEEEAVENEGFPSWWTLNANCGFDFNENLSILAVVENLMNVHYKPFASGASAPGFNFSLTLRGTI